MAEGLRKISFEIIEGDLTALVDAANLVKNPAKELDNFLTQAKSLYDQTQTQVPYGTLYQYWNTAQQLADKLDEFVDTYSIKWTEIEDELDYIDSHRTALINGSLPRPENRLITLTKCKDPRSYFFDITITGTWETCDGGYAELDANPDNGILLHQRDIAFSMGGDLGSGSVVIDIDCGGTPAGQLTIPFQIDGHTAEEVKDTIESGYLEVRSVHLRVNEKMAELRDLVKDIQEHVGNILILLLYAAMFTAGAAVLAAAMWALINVAFGAFVTLGIVAGGIGFGGAIVFTENLFRDYFQTDSMMNQADAIFPNEC